MKIRIRWKCIVGFCLFVSPFYVFAPDSFGADAALSWNRSPDSDVTGYKLYQGTASRNYGAPLDVGNVVNYSVTGLSPGTYYFAVTAYNSRGLESAFSAEVFKTFTPAPTVPLTISLIAVSDITATSAKLSWTTSLPALCEVEYGTISYGTSSALDTRLAELHSVTLTGLAPASLYHFAIKSRDASGNRTISSGHTFQTPALVDSTGPAITSVTVIPFSGTGALIRWDTNELSDSQVDYGLTTSYGSSSTLDTQMTGSHSVTLTDLVPSSLYHFAVKSRDAGGNRTTSSGYTFRTPAVHDSTAPVITSVTVSPLGRTAVSISWKTDEPSDSQIEYGSKGHYLHSTLLNPALSGSHTQLLHDLTYGKMFHFRVKSRDAAANLAVSDDLRFTTAVAEPATFYDGLWTVDRNVSGSWEGPGGGDDLLFLGEPGDVPVSGDWNGTGTPKLGVFRAGHWFIDFNGNGHWDGIDGGDRTFLLGEAGDIPVVADWNGSGSDKAGVYRGGRWELDFNGNGRWDGIAQGDRIGILGEPGDLPVTGDWNGSGAGKIGVYHNGTWRLDFDGDVLWSEFGPDRSILLGDEHSIPVIGDWNGTGTDKVGVFRSGEWRLDFDGDGIWQENSEIDRIIWLGQEEDTPVVGDWNGSTTTKVGVFRGGLWELDFNGNGKRDGAASGDRLFYLGGPFDLPVVLR